MQIWLSFNVLCTPRIWSLGVPGEGKDSIPGMLSQSTQVLGKAAAPPGWTAPTLGPYLRDPKPTWALPQIQWVTVGEVCLKSAEWRVEFQVTAALKQECQLAEGIESPLHAIV